MRGFHYFFWLFHHFRQNFDQITEFEIKLQKPQNLANDENGQNPLNHVCSIFTIIGSILLTIDGRFIKSHQKFTFLMIFPYFGPPNKK